MKSEPSLVNERIEKMEPGSVFDYAHFQKDKIEESALAMTLSRLSKEGKIMRIAKGKYYKPETSKFGPLRPKESAIIEALTTQNGQRIGYLTGIPIYNKLGLTSQVSNTLEIATNKPLPSKEVQGYRVKYQKRNVPIRDQDISLLQLLDAIKDIKDIPDASPDQVLPVVLKQIESLTPQEQQRLVKLALNYNASTRALLGAIFQKVGINVMLDQLSKSLNKLTKYNIGISVQVLPDKRNWNIL